ncbi:hypothetical protein LCGC14_1149780 [marine sediment metagenome]|uniref:SPOR domain-containing protein n=1 Tax=marine sediment metagenome TaxID=412755 RepID=A0A0F9LVS9_9ZZZZ
MKRGNWTDNHCFYVSVVDGNRYALLAGPFKTHKESLDMVDKVKDKGQELDRKGVFYAFGTVKMENGYREGSLNKYFDV